eukprot:29797-Pelagococcus_subviridis.AAC.6
MVSASQVSARARAFYFLFAAASPRKSSKESSKESSTESSKPAGLARPHLHLRRRRGHHVIAVPARALVVAVVAELLHRDREAFFDFLLGEVVLDVVILLRDVRISGEEHGAPHREVNRDDE